MASQPAGGGVEPRGAADRPARSTKGDPAWAALHERMDELLAMTGLTSFAFGQQIGMNKSTVSRYFNRQPGGEVHLCKWDLMHKLMAVAENAAGQVLGEDYRLETLRLYHAVAALDARRDLTQITDLLGQIEHATANLSHAYFEIRRLEAEVKRLRRERLPTDRTEQQVRVQHLEAEKWAGVRQALRAQAAALDEQAPADQWILREPGPQPGTDPQPSWWPRNPGRAAASGRRTARPTPTAIGLGLALVLALTAAVLAALALSNHPTTPQAGPADSGTSAASTAAPTTLATSPDAPATPATPSGGAQSAADAGLTVKYSDTSISMPSDGQDCTTSGIDFDALQGKDNVGAGGINGNGYAAPAPYDLYAQAYCIGSYYGDGPYVGSGEQWGTAPAQQPAPAQCLQDAKTNAMPNEIDASTFTVGSAYCMITDQGNLAWFTVTDNDKGSYTVTATLWTQE